MGTAKQGLQLRGAVMATSGEAKSGKRSGRSKYSLGLDEIGGLGYGQRRFIAWLWLTEDAALGRVEAGSKAHKELCSMGFRFRRYAYLGNPYSQRQSDDISRCLKIFVKRSFIVLYSETGKHTSHIRLTERGRTAGGFYHHFGYCSPAELETAVEFGAYWERKELQEVKRHMMFPDSVVLPYGAPLEPLAAKLDAEISTKEADLIHYLLRLSPRQRGETIELAHKLLEAAKKHELTDGSPYPFYSPLESGYRSVN